MPGKETFSADELGIVEKPSRPTRQTFSADELGIAEPEVPAASAPSDQAMSSHKGYTALRNAKIDPEAALDSLKGIVPIYGKGKSPIERVLGPAPLTHTDQSKRPWMERAFGAGGELGLGDLDPRAWGSQLIGGSYGVVGHPLKYIGESIDDASRALTGQSATEISGGNPLKEAGEKILKWGQQAREKYDPKGYRQGAVGGAVGMAPALAAPTALLPGIFGSQMGNDLAEAASQQPGIKPWQVAAMRQGGGLIGILTGGGVNAATKGTVAPTVGERVASAATAANAGALLTTATNLLERAVYNKQKDLLEGVPDSMLTLGIIGFAHAHGNPLNDDQVGKLAKLYRENPEAFARIMGDVAGVKPFNSGPTDQQMAAHGKPAERTRSTTLKIKARNGRSSFALPGEADLGLPAGYEPPVPGRAPEPRPGERVPIFNGSGEIVGYEPPTPYMKGTKAAFEPTGLEPFEQGTPRVDESQIGLKDQPPEMNPAFKAQPEPTAPTGSTPRADLVSGRTGEEYAKWRQTAKDGEPIPEHLEAAIMSDPNIKLAHAGLMPDIDMESFRWIMKKLGLVGVTHGSGATFDRPDLKKVLTGEGNLSYGWGFYTGEKTDTGKSYYKDAITRVKTPSSDYGFPFKLEYKHGAIPEGTTPSALSRARDSIAIDMDDWLHKAYDRGLVDTPSDVFRTADYKSMFDKAVERSTKDWQKELESRKRWVEKARAELREARDTFDKAQAFGNEGSTHVAGILYDQAFKKFASENSRLADAKGVLEALDHVKPGDLETSRNEDASLSRAGVSGKPSDYVSFDDQLRYQDPKVLKAFQEIYKEHHMQPTNELERETGKGAYNRLASDLKLTYQIKEPAEAMKAASLNLKRQGLQGNRYFDGFSRNSPGEKTYNYVLFDEPHVKLFENITKQLREDSDFMREGHPGITKAGIEHLKSYLGDPDHPLNQEITKQQVSDLTKAVSNADKAFETGEGTTDYGPVGGVRYAHAGLDLGDAFDWVKGKVKESMKSDDKAWGPIAGAKDIANRTLDKLNGDERVDWVGQEAIKRMAVREQEKEKSIQGIKDLTKKVTWVPYEVRGLVGDRAPEGVSYRKPGEITGRNGDKYFVFAGPDGRIKKVLPANVWETIARAESGKDVSGTPLGDAVMRMQAVWKALDARARALDPDAQRQFRADYMGHEWEFYNDTQNKSAGKRVFPTVMDGIRAGFEPKTADYFKTFTNKVASAEQFLAMRELAKSALEQKIIEPKPEGKVLPGGKEAIESSMFNVGGKQMMADPEIARMFNRLTSKGFGDDLHIDPNKWTMAIQEATRGIPGLRGEGIQIHGDPVERLAAVNTAIVSFRFAISLAHATNIGKVALGEMIAGGLDRAMAGKNPFGVGEDLKFAWQKANSFRDAYRGLKEDPQLAPYVKMFTEWGMRLGRDEAYQPRFGDQFREALMESKWAKATGLFPLAVTDATSHWIMGYMVPRVKLLAAMSQMHRVMEAHPEIAADPAKLRQYGQSISKSIDNRFGQLVYDNLLTRRAVRDVMHWALQAPGWQIGDIREAAGAVKDVKNLGVDLAKKLGGDKGPIRNPQQLQQVVGYAIAAAVVGSMYGYLAYGKKPEDITDMYFPQTGRVVNGKPERDRVVGYDSDAVAAYHDFKKKGPFFGALDYFKNKQSPALSVGTDLFGRSQTDFNGMKIKDNPGRYAAEMADPLAIKMLLNAKDKGETGWHLAKGWFGVGPAASHIGMSDALEFLSDKMADKMPRAISAEEFDKRKTMSRLRGQASSGDYQPLLDAAGKEMSGKQIMNAFQNNTKDAIAIKARMVSFPDAVEAYKMAEGQEKEAIKRVLAQRVLGYARSGAMSMSNDTKRDIELFKKIQSGEIK